MKATQILESRKQLRWSRTELSTRTGITPSAINYIEAGRRPPTEAEIEALTRAFMVALGQVVTGGDGNEPGAVVPMTQLDDVIAGVQVTRSYSWRGLKRHDQIAQRCRIAGESGIFNFQFHHVDERQEYVQVYGPVSMKNPPCKIRCVRSDQVRDARNRKLKEIT